MKSEKQNNKFKNIVLDIYYRAIALPALFVLWILIIIWCRRVEKHKIKLAKYRNQLDHWWILSDELPRLKKEQEEKKIKKFERKLLEIENEYQEDEERLLKNNELLHRYLGKVFDPNIGKPNN